MQRVISDATKAIGCEAAIVILREQKQWIIRYAYGFPEEIIGLKLSERQALAMAFVAQAKKAVAFNDAYNDSRLDTEQMQAYQIRSVLIAPLIARGQDIGCLSFQYRTKKVSFTAEQIDFADKLAATVSLAIENANLYAAERHISQTLQEALLTMPENIPGLDFSYLYHSASQSSKVGGDFYDLFELEHNRVGVTIGDISGKGLPAATLTSLVRNVIKVYSYEENLPASVMTKTNKIVLKSTRVDIFTTVLFGILDLNTGLFTYCCCGHPPAIIKKQENKALMLEANSPAIGVLASLNFVSSVVQLQRGEILILYTDGVTEARRGLEFFGLDRLQQLVTALPAKTPSEVVPTIFNQLTQFTGGNFKDDIALLALSLK